MSPSQPQRGGTIHNDSEVAQIFNPIARSEAALTPQIRGNTGRLTFSGHEVERLFRSPELRLEVFGWRLVVRRSERGVTTFDSRLYIQRTSPVINFDTIPLQDCQFTLSEESRFTNGRRIEGEGRLVNYNSTFRQLEIEVLQITIRVPEPHCQPIYPLAVDFGKSPMEWPNKKAEALLLSVLDKEQQDQYRAEKRFHYFEQVKHRRWRFRFTYHYPVQYLDLRKTIADEFLGLCIDLDQETPTEDILLICYLEVKGGRGDELIEAGTHGVGTFTLPLQNQLRSGARPQAVGFDEVEAYEEYATREGLFRAMTGARDRETATSAIDHARLNRERLLRAHRERFSRILGDLRENTERLSRSMARATENLQYLRRVFQQATVGGATRVSCSSALHDWMRENIAQANFTPVGDRIASIGTLFGMNIIVDPNQREPFRVVDNSPYRREPIRGINIT